MEIKNELELTNYLNLLLEEFGRGLDQGVVVDKAILACGNYYKLVNLGPTTLKKLYDEKVTVDTFLSLLSTLNIEVRGEENPKVIASVKDLARFLSDAPDIYFDGQQFYDCLEECSIPISTIEKIYNIKLEL